MTLLLLAAPLIGGCGYHFAASGAGLPSNATTIYVAKFQNLSRNTGLQEEFARYLKDEIANHKRLVLVDNPANADLRLTGTIRSQENLPGAYNAVAEPSTYNLTMMVDARLVDRSNNVIWSTRGLSEENEYGMVPNAVVVTSPKFLQQNLRANDINQLPNVQVANTQRQAANQQNMEMLARDLYSSMSEGF
ncbi:MAG TPA: LptE family protein [Candidatus Binataceae bacterium]|nr:LptE family protein [Candidatus Binataceae bacterium]